MKMGETARTEIAGVIVEHGLAESIDSTQTNPQVLGDRVTENLEVSVCKLELRGSLFEPPSIDPMPVDRDLDRAAQLGRPEWFDKVSIGLRHLGVTQGLFVGMRRQVHDRDVGVLSN